MVKSSWMATCLLEVQTKAAARGLCLILALCAAEAARAQSIVGWGITGFSNIDDLGSISAVSAGAAHTVVL